MADTLTPHLKLTNQQEGANNNTWGQIADANFEEIDDKFGDVTAISTTGGNSTLTEEQERVNAIAVSGTLATNAVIIFSGRGGSWVIDNNTDGAGSVTCKVSGQTGVVVEQGGAALVWCNGTDILLGNPPSSAVAEVTVASAATCDILGAASEFIAISGTTPITSLGTGATRKRFVRATGAFTLTHHATSLICPGGENIIAAAGDTFVVVADASSNARICAFQRASGRPLGFASASTAGLIMAWPVSAIPSGWLECNGQAVSRTTYAVLFALIGVTYGPGNGTTTFNLPDYRGYFLRGQDAGAAADPDAASRTDRGDGTTGDAVGTKQAAATGAHTHAAGTLAADSAGDHRHQTIADTGADSPTALSDANAVNEQGEAGSGGAYYALRGSASDATIGRTSSTGAHTHAISGASASAGGNETRAKNVAVKWIILALPVT